MKTLQYIVIAFFASLLPVLAADPPTENQGANAVADKIREESKGFLRVVKFTKTNGQKANVNGIDVYTMECSVEVVANQDCAMTGFEFGGGWNGSFGALKAQKGGNSLDQFNPFGAAYGTNKQVARGARMTFNLNLSFDLTERGWRVEGRLPTDKPFVAQEAPAESVPQQTKPNAFSRNLIGKWQGGRHLTQYFPNGTYTLDDVELQPPSRWHIAGDQLIQDSFSAKIVSLTEAELVIKDSKTGKEYRSTRVPK